jgi:hypothetical protein
MKKKIVFLLTMTMFILSTSAQRGWNGNNYYHHSNMFGYGGYGVGWGGWNGGLGNNGNGGIQITSPIGSFSMNFPVRQRNYGYTQTYIQQPCVQSVHVHNQGCSLSEKVYEKHRFVVTDTDGNFIRYETEFTPVWRQRLICGYP